MDRLRVLVAGTLVVLLALALGAPVRPATAQPGSPKAFLEAIYANYLGMDSKGIPLSKPADVRRYFTPPLANAINKDFAASARKQEPPELNGDPFINAQDWEIANLRIDVTESGKDKATATVRFDNAGQAKTVTLDLVKLPAGWRIADIRSEGLSLRAMYKLR